MISAIKASVFLDPKIRPAHRHGRIPIQLSNKAPFLFEVGQHFFDHVDRDGEANAGTRCIDGRIDTDNLSADIDQRTSEFPG